jgi:NADPH:quinone reductase-like Zn-dependent oxidoreductase
MVDRIGELRCKSVIVTAAASQISRMIIKLCGQNGITPICLVRREEQAEFLRKEYKQKFVVNTSDKDYKKQMGMICSKLRPEACLECVSGQTTGEMLDYMGFESTLILYGLLSDMPAGGIKTIGFIGKSQTIESFLLTNYLAKKTLTQYIDFILKAEPLFTTDLTTVI